MLALAALLARAEVQPPPTAPVVPGLRLPRDVVPVRYAPRLTIDPALPTFGGTIDIDVRVERPTDVVWLNYGFPRVFGRVLARTVRRAWTGEVLYSGNRESLRRSFLSRESILWWTMTQFGRYRREYAALMSNGAAAQASWHELRRPREVHALLRVLGSDL